MLYPPKGFIYGVRSLSLFLLSACGEHPARFMTDRMAEDSLTEGSVSAPHSTKIPPVSARSPRELALEFSHADT